MFSIRYISIIGILVIHFLGTICLTILRQKGFMTSGPLHESPSLSYTDGLLDFLGFSFTMNVVKPATIFFFIISGYLFEINFSKYRLNGFISFAKKKFNSLFKPYLIVFVLPTYLIFLLAKPFSESWKSGIDIFGAFHELLVEVAFSNYWFIPVLMVYFFINFFIKEDHLRKALIISVPITLFYSFNIYATVIPITTHTIAIPGFITFFFLGRWLYIRKNEPISFNKEINLILVLMLLVASTFESYLIFYKFNNLDFLNTLKITNILYSILLFNLLVKYISLEEIIAPSVFKPYNSYFIYLLHPFFVEFINNIIIKYPGLFDAHFFVKALLITLISIIFTFLISKQILNIRMYNNKRLEQVIF